MGTTFAPGQVSKLQNDVNIAVATALPKVVDKLDPKVVLRALEGRGEIFAGHIETALEQAIGRMLVLMQKGATITFDSRHDPDSFFRTRKGLWVGEEFRFRVVAKAEASTTVPAFKHVDLPLDMNDAKIEKRLGDRHFFTETETCALIADLIAKQEGGTEGELLNNGYSDLFYLVSCVVRVVWYADGRKWRVCTWRRNDCGWNAGSRAFSPAN